ncbi:MAG: hypothetical protein HY343_08945 [Lentisphaerae bacterium]|nr:hypothetical protein [Lentisphaerota bacterium]
MKRLVESWIEAEKSRGNSLAAAIRRLNESRRMHVTHSRVSEWRRGIHAPSHVVLSYMLCRTLPWALGQVGLDVSAEQLNDLSGLFWQIRKQRDGRVFFELT